MGRGSQLCPASNCLCLEREWERTEFLEMVTKPYMCGGCFYNWSWDWHSQGFASSTHLIANYPISWKYHVSSTLTASGTSDQGTKRTQNNVSLKKKLHVCLTRMNWIWNGKSHYGLDQEWPAFLSIISGHWWLCLTVMWFYTRTPEAVSCWIRPVVHQGGYYVLTDWHQLSTLGTFIPPGPSGTAKEML